MSKNADMSIVRLMNYRTVWDFVYANGEVTIPMISRGTGLSLPTVTRAVEYSIGEGLLLSCGADKNGARGRNAQSFCFNQGYMHVLFICVHFCMLHYEVHDFGGNVLKRGAFETNDETILNDFDTVIKSCANDYPKLGIIGVSFSGTVLNGKIIEAYSFPSLNGFDMQSEFEARYDKFVFVENDLKSAASAVQKYAPQYKHGVTVAFLYGNLGYGSGVLINGRILHGATGAAGKLGEAVVTQENRRSTEFYGELLQTVISLFDPERIIMYPNANADTKRVIELGTRRFPFRTATEFIIGRDFTADTFLGLSAICKKKLLKPNGKIKLLKTAIE